MKKTLFQLIDETSQAEVARLLGESKATINRCYHADTPVNERVLERASEVWGKGFDRDKTALVWLDKRAARGGRVVDDA